MESQNEKIERILALTEETNRIVRDMRRSRRIASFFRFIYLVALIGLTYWGYLQLQPYLGKIKQAYDRIDELNKTTQEVDQQVKANSNIDVQQILDKIRK